MDDDSNLHGPSHSDGPDKLVISLGERGRQFVPGEIGNVQRIIIKGDLHDLSETLPKIQRRHRGHGVWVIGAAIGIILLTVITMWSPPTTWLQADWIGPLVTAALYTWFGWLISQHAMVGLLRGGLRGHLETEYERRKIQDRFGD